MPAHRDNLVILLPTAQRFGLSTTVIVLMPLSVLHHAPGTINLASVEEV